MAADVDQDKAEREQWRVKAANLQNLTHTPGWDTYLADLRTLERETIDEMIQGDTKTFDYCKGKLAGLRLAINQPEVVIKLVREAY